MSHRICLEVVREYVPKIVEAETALLHLIVNHTIAESLFPDLKSRFYFRKIEICIENNPKVV